MIHVLATIELHPGNRAAFLEEFRKLIPAVHSEAGCLEYGPAVDLDSGIPAQAPLREEVVVIVEKWESLDHLKAHLVAPHMHDYRPRVSGMIAKTTLAILEPA